MIEEPKLLYFFSTLLVIYADFKSIKLMKEKKTSIDLSFTSEAIILYCSMLRVLLIFSSHHLFSRSILLPILLSISILIKLYKIIVIKKL